jgi:DNA polymerase-3 subunit delta
MSSLQELQKLIQAGQLPGLILLYGPESYFIDRGLAAVRAAVIDPAYADFNQVQFHGRDFKPVEVIDQARTLPVFAERRLVVIRGLDDASAAQLDGLLPYVEEPVDETVLLLTAGKIDARRKLFQRLKKRGLAIQFKAIYDNQLPTFVRELAAERRIGLTGGALKLFCKRVGTNLVEVSGEMEKLASYLGERDLADEQDVAAIVSDTRVESIFNLTDALGQGDIAEALRLLKRLLGEGQPPLMVLAMMTRHFRQLWKISELLTQRVPQKELPGKVGVSPYFVDGLVRQSKRFRRAGFSQLFGRFLETDLALKSSGSEAEAHLEQLVFAISGVMDK